MGGRTKRVIRLTEREARLLGEVAAAVGISTEDYMKQAVLQWTSRLIAETKRRSDEGEGAVHDT